MGHVQLSKKDMEAKWRMIITKVEQARDEMAYLCEGGIATLPVTQGLLDKTLAKLLKDREVAAKKHGFVIKESL
jgi:hypothetical protein